MLALIASIIVVIVIGFIIPANGNAPINPKGGLILGLILGLLVLAFAAQAGHNGTAINASTLIKKGRVYKLQAVVSHHGEKYAVVTDHKGNEPRLVAWDRKNFFRAAANNQEIKYQDLVNLSEGSTFTINESDKIQIVKIEEGE